MGPVDSINKHLAAYKNVDPISPIHTNYLDQSERIVKMASAIALNAETVLVAKVTSQIKKK